MVKKWEDKYLGKPTEDGSYPDETPEPINTYLTTDLDEASTGNLSEGEDVDKQTEEMTMSFNKDGEKFQITDQYGELLLECSVGDKYHRLIVQEGLNKILKEAVEHWEKDDADYHTDFDGFPKLPHLKEDMNKYRMMKALEDLHKYFSDDDAEISEETFDLLEELFGELDGKWRNKE